MRYYFLVLVVAAIHFLNLQKLSAQQNTVNNYNVRWTTPSANAQGSMPIGNGDIGANVWVGENGDLVFYVSKTDAWSEIDRLLKLGKVRVSIAPNPFKEKTFSQELNLQNGEVFVNYGDTKIRFWIDANHPVIQVDVESREPVQVKVAYETWRKKRIMDDGKNKNSWGYAERYVQKECLDPIFQEPDSIIAYKENKIIANHHNHYSVWKNNLELQALGDFTKTNKDPLLHRNTGLMIEGPGLVSENDTLLVSSHPLKKVQIQIFSLTKKGTVEDWMKSLFAQARIVNKISTSARQHAHQRWWKEFWNRSYIFVSAKDSSENKKAQAVTRGYILQRFINAGSGRGNSPIKFNGSIFTVDTYNRNGSYSGLDADFRQWGGCYWWQNTRLPYWSMLLSGDFDLMQPVFEMYRNALPLRKVATKKYYNHEGAFFPETMHFWGTYSDVDYGCNREGRADGYTSNPYVRYYWSGGLELSLMLCDYYAFTRDKLFAQNTLIPLVSEILTFYDQHWKRGSNRKILFDPAMSLETHHTAVNPLPEIIGTRVVGEKLLRLPQSWLTEEKRAQFKKLINDLPAVPLRTEKGETVLSPAQEYSNKANIENPEMYAVFPYRAYGMGKPNIDLAKRTFAHKVSKHNGGWQQNSIQAACLGLANEAKNMVVESFSAWDNNFRFPAFWGPNYDWTPDQDHGTVAMIALQRMLMQYEDANTTILPAWPKEWNVNFKLNAPYNATVEGIYKNGKIEKLAVTPESGRRDVAVKGQ